jgi:hypothetical protein
MTATVPVREGERISIEDIRAKMHELSGGLDEGVRSARQGGGAVAVAAVVVVVVVAFWLGTRRGKRRQTFVEIRRV